MFSVPLHPPLPFSSLSVCVFFLFHLLSPPSKSLFRQMLCLFVSYRNSCLACIHRVRFLVFAHTYISLSPCSPSAQFCNTNASSSNSSIAAAEHTAHIHTVTPKWKYVSELVRRHLFDDKINRISQHLPDYSNCRCYYLRRISRAALIH